jgi:hypothetical protein
VLGEGTRIYSLDESVRVVAMLVISFPFNQWGCISWHEVNHKFEIKNNSELIHIKELELEDEYLIIWDEMNLPVIESSLKKIISNLDDITAVGFNTWIVNKQMNRIIEIHHEGEITIGINKVE